MCPHFPQELNFVDEKICVICANQNLPGKSETCKIPEI